MLGSSINFRFESTVEDRVSADTKSDVSDLISGWVGRNVEESGAICENWILSEAKGAEGVEPLVECEAWSWIGKKDTCFVSNASGDDGSV